MFDDNDGAPTTRTSSREARLRRAYREGFRKVTKKIPPSEISCPYDVLDDPAMDRTRAWDMGQAAAMAFLNGRRAV